MEHLRSVQRSFSVGTATEKAYSFKKVRFVEVTAAMFLSPLASPVFGGVPAPVEFLGRAHEPLMFQVAGEDVAHLLGFGLVDEYASARRIDVVTKYWTTAYPTLFTHQKQS